MRCLCKKRISKVVISLIIAFILMFSFSGCFLFDQRSEEEKARDGVVFYTGIEVPTDAEIVYHHADGFRDYLQYTVFQFESEPTVWLNENLFFVENDQYFGYDFNRACQSWANYKDIPAEYQVELNNAYWGLKKETHFLVFLPNELRLIVYLVTY